MINAKIATGLALTIFASVAPAQSGPLSLEDALAMAKKRNGTIRAAEYNVFISDERVKQSLADFLPKLEGTYTYRSSQQQTQTLGAKAYTQQEGGSSNLLLTHRILDLGERNLGLKAARQLSDSERYRSLQTLRGTLFTVVQQYYETLRAQELQRVSTEQVGRTDLILKQTIARIAVRDEAAKDQLQAEADNLNAKVQVLSAQNRTTNAVATLKATIGLDAEASLPALAAPTLDTSTALAAPLSSYLKDGLELRPDLLAERRSIASLRFQKQLADRQAGLGASLDLQVGDQLTPTNLFGRAVSLNLTYPLFDGGRLRSIARAQGLGVKVAEQNLLQDERSVRAQIESAYKEAEQDAERLAAATKAVEAAQKNFDAAADSQKAGASTIIEVSTARVSLVTAQSEYIQAIYDLAIARAQLELVSGHRVPGQ